jgi:hypothetical protein
MRRRSNRIAGNAQEQAILSPAVLPALDVSLLHKPAQKCWGKHEWQEWSAWKADGEQRLENDDGTYYENGWIRPGRRRNGRLSNRCPCGLGPRERPEWSPCHPKPLSAKLAFVRSYFNGHLSGFKFWEAERHLLRVTPYSTDGTPG